MEKVRIGNDIQVKYTVLRDGLPESFVGATDITVTVTNEAYKKAISNTFDIVGNIVNISIDAADFNLCGKYRVTLKYVRGNDIEIDALAFEGVQYTSLTGGTEIVGVEIVTVNISGDIGIAIPDNNKIDLDGLNSNIRQIKFNTDTPVAPTQAGQMAWSDEEKTGVLHNGHHSHPIGKETFFTAKNLSGTSISNGKAVYAIGSTGENATIGLATTSDGDIAQRTIGIATMDIPANGFGDVTTFGEVNDINTSGLTEGALVYLGLNGNLTSVEPVAPTPKISLGLCIRSHLTQGRIAVYVRPIARLNKLTDVHAPNLLDGDVLRWNDAALRYEVYNLVNKADLVGGKIPTSQLPAYVDDVLEYANLATFPATGETGKIYVALETNLTYRWSGTAYVEISKSLALGETSDTAYRGDRGKTAYDHSQATGNPHSTTAAQIPNTPAGTVAATTVQGAINELAGDIVQVETNLNNVIYEFEYNLNVEVHVESLDLMTGTFYKSGHGFSNGNEISAILNIGTYSAAISVFPSAMPNDTYYVVEATQNSFKISSSINGAPITFVENAKMDLTKWHFEKNTNSPFSFTNLPNLRSLRVVLLLRSLKQTQLYINQANYSYNCFSKPTESNPTQSPLGYPALNAPKSYNGLITINISEDVIGQYSVRGHCLGYSTAIDRMSVQSIDRYVATNRQGIPIDFLSFSSHSLANGTKIKLYKY